MQFSPLAGAPARLAAALALAFALAACASMPSVPGFGAKQGADVAAIEAAIANPARPADDVAEDGKRHPLALLSFLGARPGLTVIDLNSGGGYYSELLSYVVGPEGRVIAHNDELYSAFAKDAPAKRVEGRLANVTVLSAPSTALGLESDSVDAALMSMAYHDWYFVPKDGARTEAADVPAALAEIKRVLRPGGVFVIIDHSAKPGSPPETGNTLHRIDPQLVKTQMAAAGFTYVGEIDDLRNPDDPLEAMVFDEAIRGKTDRFVFKFEKPKG